MRKADRLGARSRAPCARRGAQTAGEAGLFHLRCGGSYDTAHCLAQRGVTVQVALLEAEALAIEATRQPGRLSESPNHRESTPTQHRSVSARVQATCRRLSRRQIVMSP